MINWLNREMKAILVMLGGCGESFDLAVNAVADVLYTLQ